MVLTLVFCRLTPFYTPPTHQDTYLPHPPRNAILSHSPYRTNYSTIIVSSCNPSSFRTPPHTYTPAEMDPYKCSLAHSLSLDQFKVLCNTVNNASSLRKEQEQDPNNVSIHGATFLQRLNKFESPLWRDSVQDPGRSTVCAAASVFAWISPKISHGSWVSGIFMPRSQLNSVVYI